MEVTVLIQGLHLLGVKNLTIEHLNITGCGMKHNGSAFIIVQFIVLHSALFILNIVVMCQFPILKFLITRVGIT